MEPNFYEEWIGTSYNSSLWICFKQFFLTVPHNIYEGSVNEKGVFTIIRRKNALRLANDWNQWNQLSSYLGNDITENSIATTAQMAVT